MHRAKIHKYFIFSNDIKWCKEKQISYIGNTFVHNKGAWICGKQKLLNSDSNLYDRYVKWQGSDEYIKEFRMT